MRNIDNSLEIIPPGLQDGRAVFVLVAMSVIPVVGREWDANMYMTCTKPECSHKSSICLITMCIYIYIAQR